MITEIVDHSIQPFVPLEENEKESVSTESSEIKRSLVWTPKLESYILEQFESTALTKPTWDVVAENIKRLFNVKLTTRLLKDHYRESLDPIVTRSDISDDESQQIRIWAQEKISWTEIGKILKRPTQVLLLHYNKIIRSKNEPFPNPTSSSKLPDSDQNNEFNPDEFLIFDHAYDRYPNEN